MRTLQLVGVTRLKRYRYTGGARLDFDVPSSTGMTPTEAGFDALAPELPRAKR